MDLLNYFYAFMQCNFGGGHRPLGLLNVTPNGRIIAKEN